MTKPFDPYLIHLPLPQPPPPQIIHTDLPCRGCGYNLRTQPASGVCPECALPIAMSMRSDMLRNSDPAWLAWIYAGLIWLSVGAAMMIYSYFGNQPFTHLPPSMNLSRWIMLGGHTTALIGAWLLTAPDPSGLGEDRMIRWRKILRTLIAVKAAQMAILTIANNGLASPSERIAVQSFALLGDLIGLAFFGVTLEYMRCLALRIPDVFIATACRNLIRFLIPAGLCIFGIGMVFLFHRIRPGFVHRSTRNMLSLISFAAFSIYGITFIGTISRLRNSLKLELEYSRRNWIGPTNAEPLK